MDQVRVSAPATTLAGETSARAGTTPLITTKTRIPRLRSDLLSRPHLVDAIHAYLDRKLIVVSAPAGYGKTSLLAEFATATDLPVCWYTLDPFDRDLHRFLEYLVSAIARRFPAFGDRSRALLRQVPDPASQPYPVVTALAQEVYDTIAEYFVLVLDDHHTVEDQDPITEFLDLFVTYIDENCHLILASRTLPALPSLSLLIARRQAAGLGIDELRFTPGEIQALALQNYGLELNLQQAQVLARRTQGWITGLLLTVAPRWQQPAVEAPSRGPVGVDLYDYFSAQVLDQQPAPLRDFLLESSVLDELSPELCADVLQTDRAACFLEEVRTRNLFVVDFEGDVNRLRHHDLFRDFLQSYLRRRDEARFRELTRRAAAAYARRGEWERAISRYLALQELEAVAGIIQHTAATLFDTGRWDTLARWLDALPAEVKTAQPDLLVQRARIHAERGEQGPALTLFELAAKAFALAGDSAGGAHVLARKATVLRYQGRYQESIGCCQKALALVGGDTPPERSARALALNNTGLCAIGLGRLDEGRRALYQAMALYEELGATYHLALAHHDLGLSHEMGGDLAGALDHYQAALACWQELGSLSPWANTLNSLGVVHYLKGEYDQARLLLNQALLKAQQAGDLRIQAYALASLGDLHCDVGAYELAQGAFGQALETARRAHLGLIIPYALDGLGNVARLRGDWPEAAKRLHQALEHAEQHGSTHEAGRCHISLGILANDRGDLEAARAHLDQAVELLAASGLQQPLARAHLHRAQTAFLAGEPAAAGADLRRALALAGELGFDQFLVVDGQHLEGLLRHAGTQGIGEKVLPGLLERITTHRERANELPTARRPTRGEPVLRIYALGQAEVKVDGQSVQWPIARSRDLFFFLLHRRQGLSKEQIGVAFWPDHDPSRLDSAFRSTLYRLRRVVSRDIVLFEEGLYRFNGAADYWFDLEAFDQLLDHAERAMAAEGSIALLEQALDLYRGDYLEGVYADWCELERERLRRRYLTAIETLAGLYAAQRKLRRAIEHYQRLLAEDPLRETAHLGLMRCYHRAGDRASAIQQYRTCASMLREELGLSPSAETEALYRQIID
jgi:LuxR family transcriptional regulator, maltose regulon positive regulatory protein